ncbi:hypothetical protein [Emcibacter sp. SYSU 3D8]|uniref:hypothetical protein n=1 Tax=Emcibacter sp. SYSU 3D8 TaxID=3133969 RepID=UPI0031FE74FA
MRREAVPERRPCQRPMKARQPFDTQMRAARQSGEQTRIGTVPLQQHLQRLRRSCVMNRQALDDDIWAEGLAGDAGCLPARIDPMTAERLETGEKNDGLAVHGTTLAQQGRHIPEGWIFWPQPRRRCR